MSTPVEFFNEMYKQTAKIVQQHMRPAQQCAQDVERINRQARELRESFDRQIEAGQLYRATAALKDQWTTQSQASFLPSNEALHGRYGRRH